MKSFHEEQSSLTRPGLVEIVIDVELLDFYLARVIGGADRMGIPYTSNSIEDPSLR